MEVGSEGKVLVEVAEAGLNCSEIPREIARERLELVLLHIFAVIEALRNRCKVLSVQDCESNVFLTSCGGASRAWASGGGGADAAGVVAVDRVSISPGNAGFSA